MTGEKMTDEDMALAGELALGLLSSGEAASARARMVSDFAFAAEVQAWEERLQPLFASTDAPAPDAVWQGVVSRIARAPAQDNGNRRLRFWQGLSGVSTAAALVLGVLAFGRPVAPPNAPLPLVAALGSETGRASMTASQTLFKI